MLTTLVDSVLRLLGKYPDAARALGTSSMTQYTKSTRTEPITMIDTSLTTLTELPDLMLTLTSIYAAMYAQSFSIAINQEIGNIKVLQTLDKINPNRSKMDNALARTVGLGMESNVLSLPSYTNDIPYDKSVITVENKLSVSKSDRTLHGALFNGTSTGTPVLDDDGNHRKDDKGNLLYTENNPESLSSSANIEAIAKFMTNLSTGILFEVHVEADRRKVSIPISVRLLANQMATATIVNLFTAATRNQTAKERYREWRAGGISFWSDVIFCKDILKSYRTNLIKDQSGMFSEVLRRKSSNQMSALLSGNPSISQISNIVIVSSETIALFERESGKKFKREDTRNLIFNNTQTLIVAVVNRDRETVTLYYHDITVPTTVTFKDLSNKSGKGGAPDVMEILKAYQMGNGINL